MYRDFIFFILYLIVYKKGWKGRLYFVIISSIWEEGEVREVEGFGGID